jgi:hydroxymethylpyrimidine kinase/phosphomethylpyrimidine kinase
MSLARLPIALTIAGFDPSGGAGVLADARTFNALEMDPVAAITSITFQNPTKFFGALHQTPATVRAQLEPLLTGPAIACAKTGMLPTVEIVREVARLFRETSLPKPVVDPVMISSSGFRLMEEAAIEVLVKELMPLAALVTPNIPEAETLAEMKIESEADMRAAASVIRQMGARAVLIKGGHQGEWKAGGSKQEAVGSKQEIDARLETVDWRLETVDWGLETVDWRLQTALDLLDNDGDVTVFRELRIPGAQLHGSGCILSAAIAAGLGKGMSLEDSVGGAKQFVLQKMRRAVGSN